MPSTPAYQRRRRLKLRALSCCVDCKRPSGGGYYCPACLAARRAVKRALYAARRAAGLCPACGGAPVKTFCAACREGKNRVDRKRRRRQKACS